MTDPTSPLAAHTERILADLSPEQRRVLDMRRALGHRPLPKRPIQPRQETPDSALLDAIFSGRSSNG